ncbi:MAG: restriction endonuclease [Acidihalobacter sp.]|uniref:restriction endonuclease n=1 Tax=Acidihalobacter sp. TaxID=1872108 RepID=UPI00307EC569
MTTTVRVSLLLRLRIWWNNHRANRKRGHRRRRRQALRVYARLRQIDGAGANARRLAYLRKVDPLAFEEMTLDAFERQGHRVLRNLRYTGDGGLDGRVMIRGVWHGIQCKRYGKNISWRHVTEFPHDLRRVGLERGIFVHTGRTPKGRLPPPGVQIISGQRLLELLLH